MSPNATLPHCISFSNASHPARNIARYYVLSIEPTLFAKHTLIRRWGRIGILVVQSRHFLERANCESLRLRSPGFADELIRGEASEGLKASGKVVGFDEVAQISAQFIVGFVEVAFDGGVLDGAVHPLD